MTGTKKKKSVQLYSQLGKEPNFNKKLLSFKNDYQDSEDRNQKWATECMHTSQPGNSSPKSVLCMVSGARAIQGRTITEMLRCASGLALLPMAEEASG